MPIPQRLFGAFGGGGGGGWVDPNSLPASPLDRWVLNHPQPQNPWYTKILELLRTFGGLGEGPVEPQPTKPLSGAPSLQDVQALLDAPPTSALPPAAYSRGGLTVGAGAITGQGGDGFMQLAGMGPLPQGPIAGTGRLAGLTGTPTLGRVSVQSGKGNYDPVRNAQLAALYQLQNVMLGVGQPNFRIESELASTPAPWLGAEYQNKQAEALIGLIAGMSRGQAPEIEAQARIQAAVAEAGERAAAERYKADTAAGAKIQEQQLAGQSELDQIKMQGILEAIKQAIGTNTDPKEAMRMVLMLLKGLSGGGGGMDQLVNGLAGGGSQGPQ